jgi:hypothetical protein
MKSVNPGDADCDFPGGSLLQTISKKLEEDTNGKRIFEGPLH